MPAMLRMARQAWGGDDQDQGHALPTMVRLSAGSANRNRVLHVSIKVYQPSTHYIALVSTCESEYIALSQGAREGRWVQRILRFMGHREEPLNLMCDNTGQGRLRPGGGYQAQSSHRRKVSSSESH